MLIIRWITREHVGYKICANYNDISKFLVSSIFDHDWWLRNAFYSWVIQTICIKKDSKKNALIPKEQYEILLGNIIEAQNSEKKTQNQYYLLQKYDILMCGDVQKNRRE